MGEERERLQGTAGPHTHGLFLSKRWWDRAQDNIETWGHQRHDTTLLAFIEEVGEIAMAFEGYNEPGGGPPFPEDGDPHYEGRELIGEMADLGRRTREFLEEHYPDPAGDGPHTPEEMEIHGDPVDTERIFEEIDDAGPLLFQLYWALERCDLDTAD